MDIIRILNTNTQRRFRLILFLCCIYLMGCAHSKNELRLSNYKGPKKRVAIVGFGMYVRTYGVKEMDRLLIEMLSTSLFKTGQFDLVERKEIERVFQEQKFQLSGMVDPATAVEIGKILGAQAIITGAITEIGFQAGSFIINMTSCRVGIDVRIIDVTTAKILMAESGTGKSYVRGIIFNEDAWDAVRKKNFEIWVSEALRNAAEDVTKKINKQMVSLPWIGSIAHVSGKSIFINSGQDVGLRTGDILEAFRCINEINDPVTKEILGCKEVKIGELSITNVRQKLSEAIPKNGSGFRIGDSVRLIADR